MTREEAIAYGKRVIDLGLNDETQAFCECAIKSIEQLSKLQNRCHALTYGQMCFFCPYDCEHRAERGKNGK